MCDQISCNNSGNASGNSTDNPLPRATDEHRRAFIKGLMALPLAVVLADPGLAQAAAQRMSAVEIKLPGGGKAEGYLALPSNVNGEAPTVLLIHEWWGLNDQIKAVANEFAEQGFIALAIDLYQGQVASSREQANNYRKAMSEEWATAALVGAIDWLRNYQGSNGKVGTIGWCFGGGWSLNAALAAPVDAAVIYYGDVRKSAAELQSLSGPVLGHFGTLDKRINAEMVGGFQREMAKAGKDDLEINWYTADHAFANPSGARYDDDDAQLAWSRTLAFFYQHLR
ncbi:MAG: dienelactone hydrolase family protein [Motiliproteus sp.]